MGVQSHDPQVCDQLLEFMHGYTVNVLRDAQVYQVRPRLFFGFFFLSSFFFSPCSRVVVLTVLSLA
jgi:hypothetical protein